MMIIILTLYLGSTQSKHLMLEGIVRLVICTIFNIVDISYELIKNQSSDELLKSLLKKSACY